MIFFSIGLPSSLAQTCDELLLRLAEVSLGSVEVCALNTLDDIAMTAIKSNAAHLVASSRQPVVRMQTEIVESGKPFLVALGDLHLALHDLLQRPEYDVIAATRALASSCAAMLTLAGAPGALVLSSKDQRDPVTLAGSIARHFGLEISGRELREIAESLDSAIGNPAAASSDELGRDQQAIVDGALAAYGTYFGNGQLAPIVWQPDLFFINESPADGTRRPAIGPIDITGRARFLIFGPYINLPPGAWSASVVIAFSAETAGISFIIEIASGTQLTYARVQPTGEQVIESNLQFTIGNSADQPIEIRVITERAAFDGRIALGSVTLVPRSGVRSETEQHLIDALHQ